jgi:class 3 adenylate cyclase/tetratricopeptide (TPR) repeat protein
MPDGARFCPSCGAPQRVEAIASEERRIVTVLFADLVGFTTLSEHRDPESVKRLVDRIFEQFVRDVETHGGVVDKVLGDAIVALFGAPIAHEDDADRAVRAALTMQTTLRDFRLSNPADAVRMRIGINTGEVLVGTLAGSDYTAMGDVVNTASRLQEVAQPGTVLVGAATRDLCSSAIRFQAVDPVQLRGRKQETAIWRAISVETAAVSRRWASDVPFVGRRAELGMMRATMSSVLAGRSAIVSISGEAGIGKSRMVEESLTSLLAEHPNSLLLEGACAPYGESNVWWPVTGGLLARLGLDRNDPAETSRRRITRRLTAGDDFEPGTPEFDRVVELVLHLLGQPSALDALGPTGLRDAAVAGIVDAIRGRAEKAPVVIWVDDIQWAAPVMIDLLETVARQLAGLPLLIVTTCRPDDQGSSDWPPPVDPALTMHLSLEALNAADSASLVDRASGKALPEQVVESISSRSGGNPLFLIELARLAAASDDPSGGELPGTLRALIAARIDQLTVTQRQVLDNAAIIGNQGRVIALDHFAAELGQTFDADDLVGIHAAGLMVRHGSRWHFRSDVVREVAYQTLTKQSRAQRHAGVARYLAAFEPGLLDRRAHHAATAAELRCELGSIPDVPGEIAHEAVRLLSLAARGWADQGAHRRCLGLVERALSIGAVDPEIHTSLLLLRVQTLVDLHDMRPARVRAGELAVFAQEIGDRILHGEACRLLGTIEQTDGNLVAARSYLSSSVAEFRDIGDDRHLAEALRARGFAEIFGGSLADADRFLGEAEELFDRLDDPRGTAWVHQHRAWVSFLSGDHDRSERRLWHAIDAFTELEDRAGKAWSLGLLGYVYHFTRRDDEALAMADEVLRDAKRWNDDWGSSMMSNLQASVWLWRGQLDDARAAAERSLAGFRKIDDRFGVVQALSTLNRVYVALGRAAEADRSVEEILALSGSFGELAYPLIAAAGTAMHLGDGSRAADFSTEAVSRLDTTGANVDEGRVIAAWGRLLQGDADGTLAQLLEVDVDRSPFALAARATALGVLGDRDRALIDVKAVESMDSVSYWDRTMAQVAGAALASGDEADRRRDELAATVTALEDVVLTGYASDVLVRLGHETLEPRVPPHGGWASVAAALAPAT